MSHTPGPWNVEHDGPSLPIVTGTVNGRWDFIAKVDHAGGDEEANARLIAAAPDMYALLRKMDGHLHAQWKAEIRAVVAKAEGK